MSSPSSPLRLDGRFLAIGLAGYARSTLASAVKILIGRKAHFTARDVLFRQYVGRLLGFETLRSVTSAHGSREGAGSNALMAMYAISFARTHGLAYVHTPFSEIYHADRPIAEWSAAWDKLFNLGAGAAASRSTPVNFALTCMDLWSLFGDAVPQPFSAEMVAEFRRRYYIDKSPRKNTTLSVAIHARHRNREDTDDVVAADLAQLAAVVSQLRAMLAESGTPCTLRLFSQGAAQDFAALGLASDELCLDADPFWSMRELIEADLLVTTKGTFSYVASLLCDGVVLADSSEYPPQPGWVPYDSSGGFDTATVLRLLSRV